MNWKELLPEALSPHLAAIEATARPCLRLELLDRLPERRWESCLGRILYWPEKHEWPKDESGQALFGLLQLNLGELPPLPGLPASGILQFFVADDANWGAAATQEPGQGRFRVVYHATEQPEKEALVKDFSFLPAFSQLPLQKDICFALGGEASSMPMPPEDVRFPTTLGKIFDELGDQKWTALNAYRQAIGTIGHRLGGYAGFAQDDPRSEDTNWELLLQLDSVPEIGLFWGDLGVAHWFYQPASTQERSLDAAPDFDAIWYQWTSS